jgi:hypothetical protein
VGRERWWIRGFNTETRRRRGTEEGRGKYQWYKAQVGGTRSGAGTGSGERSAAFPGRWVARADGGACGTVQGPGTPRSRRTDVCQTPRLMQAAAWTTWVHCRCPASDDADEAGELAAHASAARGGHVSRAGTRRYRSLGRRARLRGEGRCVVPFVMVSQSCESPSDPGGRGHSPFSTRAAVPPSERASVPIPCVQFDFEFGSGVQELWLDVVAFCYVISGEAHALRVCHHSAGTGAPDGT